jgi:LysR family transcriptional regulator, glycine cleavage system transcriptional activator
MRLSYLNALRALEASVRNGSFKAAARELGVTPAAVGQQVRSLEAALGQRLLVRHVNGFEPTEATRLAAARLATGFEELRKALEMMARDTAPKRVSVTVTPTIAERWLAPRLSNFLARHPEVDLRIDSTPYVHDARSDEFDFAIRWDKPGRSGEEETLLFREVLIPVCTPSVAPRIGRTDRRDCLREAPLLHVDRSTDDPDWLHWDEWGERFGYEIPTVQQRIQFTSTTLVLRAVHEGHGLHLAQLSICIGDLTSGRLVAPFGIAACVRPGYQYSLVRMRPGRLSPLHRTFQNWIADEGRKSQADMDAYLASGGVPTGL